MSGSCEKCPNPKIAFPQNGQKQAWIETCENQSVPVHFCQTLEFTKISVHFVTKSFFFKLNCSQRKFLTYCGIYSNTEFSIKMYDIITKYTCIVVYNISL